MAKINWLTGTSGQWTTGANWSGGAAPGTSDDVLIAAAPAAAGLPYTVTLNNNAAVNSVTLQQKLATLAVSQGTLTVGTAFNLSAGSLLLDYGNLAGSAGATVTAAAASTVQLAYDTYGTLSNLLWRGALNLVANSFFGGGDASLFLDDVTFSGANGTGAGTLSVGAGVAVDAGPAGSLANVHITLANGAQLTDAFGGTIVLASTTHLSVGAGNGATINVANLTNAGLISVSGTAAALSISQDNYASSPLFDNTGTLTVSNGAAVSILSTSVTNSGLMSIASGGFLEIGAPANDYPPGPATFTNTGTITDHGGTLALQLSLVTAQLAGFGITDGTLDIAGAVNNAGATLTSGTASGSSAQHLVLDGGTITGGTVVNTGAFAIASGTLTGVAFQGPLDVVGINAALTINGGFALASNAAGGASTISVQNGDLITFEASQTLSDTVIDLNGTLMTGDSNETVGATLTLGAATKLIQSGSYTGLQAYRTGTDVVINKGSLVLGFASGEFNADGLVNLGHIAVSQGDTLSGIASNSGTITAGDSAIIDGVRTELNEPTFSNSGLISDSQAGGTLAFGGSLDNSGTIAVSNGATLVLNDPTQNSYGATLTNTGTISVTDGVLLANAITASELETVTLVHSSVIATGGLSIDTAAPLRVGRGTALGTIKLSGGLSGGTVIDTGGGIAFYGIETLENITYQGTLQINRPLTTLIVQEGFAATSGANGTAPGIINLTGAGTVLGWNSPQALNNATLSIGNATLSYDGQAIPAPTLASSDTTTTTFGAHLTIDHAATFATIGGQLGTSNSLGTIASAATIHATLAGGPLSLEGADFTSTGAITITNGDTVTDGATAFTNAGAITIGAASTLALDTYNYFASATFADTQFTNTGTIALYGGTLTELTAAGAFPALPILNTGTIRGAGLLDTQIDNTGAIVASGGTLTLDQSITGAGRLIVGAGATLNLAATGAGQRVTFGGASGVLGLSPPAFHAKLIAFVSGDAIDLAHTAATSAAFAGDSISVTLSSGSTLSLATTSALSGSLTTLSDGHGGTLIEFAGAAHAATPSEPPPPSWGAQHYPDIVAHWTGVVHAHAQ